MLRQGRMHGSDGSATGAETPLPAQHQAEMDTLFTGVSSPTLHRYRCNLNGSVNCATAIVN